ncbi:hypothetical protein N9185_00660 [bacterium]|nr:hypothetical protein [bacterium]
MVILASIRPDDDLFGAADWTSLGLVLCIVDPVLVDPVFVDPVLVYPVPALPVLSRDQLSVRFVDLHGLVGQDAL